MLGKTISHYRVLRKLGGGGMGVVYEALDFDLDRHVALKFLPDELGRDAQALERFRREARAASALNHPNICTIYEIGTSDGQCFIAMEFLDGQTLKHRIKGRPLENSVLIETAIQISDAIAAAHEKGIIHRDIKPANIFVSTGGHVKLLDFGLAKLASTGAAAISDADTMDVRQQLTRAGDVVGTVAYMSPEQVAGKQLDARTDLFSFGVVLYEMASGVLPFRGDTSGIILNSILERAPVSPIRLNPDLPQKLDEVITKALEKDRDIRCQSAAEIRADLKRLKRDLDSSRAVAAIVSAPAAASTDARAATSKGFHRYARVGVIALAAVAIALGAYLLFGKPESKKLSSIAVLPFQNATSDSNNEYLSDGLTEDLISTLSQLPNVKVMARSTVFHFKGHDDDPRQIGEKLKVGAVLTGRITQRGDELGIHAELVDTADGTELWGGQYVRKLADISKLQAEITRDISNKLQIHSSEGEQQRLTRGSTNNAQAYQLYQQGRYYWNGRTSEGLRKSIDLFHQAIESDPSYALAYTGLADTYNVVSSYNLGITARQAHERGEQAARKALELDGSLPEAHTAMAVVLSDERKWEEAEREYQQALELNPNSAAAHYFFGFTVLLPEKRFDEALKEIQSALSLDPLSPIVNVNRAATLMAARRYPESLAEFRHALELDKNFGPTRQKLSLLYAATGRYEDAVSEWQKFMFMPGSWSQDAKGYGKLVTTSLIEGRRRTGYEPASFIATGYAVAGDREKTFEWLDRAVVEGDDQLAVYVRYPHFDDIRSDPRYPDLMHRLRLPE
jgi:eukaryotic-like serine/threonine-protein kinase